jgi:hypothetical protein
MFLRDLRGRAALALLALGVASPAPALAAIDLIGVTSATFEWQPAAGPVSGYVVYQICAGGTGTQKSVVSATRTTLTDAGCKSFTVQVAAYGAGGTGQPGPFSSPSQQVNFLPAPAAPLPQAAPSQSTFSALGRDPGGGVLPPPDPLDFDGDGRADLLLHRPADGALELWTIYRTLLKERIPLPALPAGARVVGNGDYDGDGAPDLLGVSGAQAFVWLIRGATPIGGGDVGDPLGANDRIEGSGDFDGDGVSDVLVRRGSQGSVEIWSMAGGSVAASDEIAADPGPAWNVIGSGDYDGDGLCDVLWYSPSQGALLLWRMLARGSFETRSVASPRSAPWEAVGAGDYDGNGRSDILWRHPQSGALEISFFASGIPLATRSIAQPAARADREIVANGDFNRDGRTDVLIRNGGTTRLRAWLLDDARVLTNLAVAEIAPGWQPVSIGAENPNGHR